MEDRCHRAVSSPADPAYVMANAVSMNRGQAGLIGVPDPQLTLEFESELVHHGRHWADRGCGRQERCPVGSGEEEAGRSGVPGITRSRI